ncbi:MAG: GNAT family N-acetyltransferase [Acidobacteriota bacterium]
MSNTLTDSDLMNIHVSALFTHNAESRLLFVNEPDSQSAPAPRLFLGRTRDGNIWRFRADLPEDLVEELNSLCADEPPLDIEFNDPPRYVERYLFLLERHTPVEEISRGPAYYFPENIIPLRPVVALTENDAERLQNGFEELVTELPAWQPFVALIKKGRAASVCRSARITPEAHEAGVETLPEFRGNAYATEVVADWARLVLKAAAIPLYSTSWKNVASQAVARKLRLKLYGADFHVT